LPRSKCFSFPTNLNFRSLATRAGALRSLRSVRALALRNAPLIFRNTFLDRVEIRQICRDMFTSRTGRFDQVDRAHRIVELHIIEQRDIVMEYARNEKFLDIRVKGHGRLLAFDAHRRAAPAQV